MPSPDGWSRCEEAGRGGGEEGGEGPGQAAVVCWCEDRSPVGRPGRGGGGAAAAASPPAVARGSPPGGHLHRGVRRGIIIRRLTHLVWRLGEAAEVMKLVSNEAELRCEVNMVHLAPDR